MNRGSGETSRDPLIGADNAAAYRAVAPLLPAYVKRLYATASIVTGDRVAFNIKGNSYRLVVAVDFEKSIAWIKWIGTHPGV